MTDTTAEVEPELRVCDICGKVDTAPRHRVAYGPGDAPEVNQDLVAAVIEMNELTGAQRAAAVAELNDTTVRSAHLDCCRDAGCFDGACDRIHGSYDGDDLKDDELLDYVRSGAVDHIGRELTEERAAIAMAQAERDAEARQLAENGV